MEAPEKIYVTECMLFATNPEITLQGNGSKIEYTRTDAIIKRVCEWLATRYDKKGSLDPNDIEDLRKEMDE